MYFGNIDPNTANEGLNGKIDDYGIWNRKLTQTEITALYNGTFPCAPPVTTSSFTYSNQTICLGQLVVFNNTSTQAASYAWSFGDGNNSSLQNPTHTYTTVGSYTINLTSTGSSTATSSSVINVVSSPTLSVNSSSTICLGNNAILSVAGNVKTDEVLKLAEKWFGPIPKGEKIEGRFFPLISNLTDNSTNSSRIASIRHG